MKFVSSHVAGAVLSALILLILPVAPAKAFVDPPTFSPAQPLAGQSIQM